MFPLAGGRGAFRLVRNFFIKGGFCIIKMVDIQRIIFWCATY